MKQNKEKEKAKIWCFRGTQVSYYKNLVMIPFILVSRCRFASTKALA